MLSSTKLMLVVVVLGAVILPSALAEDLPVPLDDPYWQDKANKGLAASKTAYTPEPVEVTESVNREMGQFVMTHNKTNGGKRQLLHEKHSMPCKAANPIDQCWRCDPNWESNRKRLAECAIGFGKNAVGGKAGDIYIVTDPSDDNVTDPKPGTLRHAVIQSEPLWIIFEHGMIITLKQELMVTCNKTIDGRGANVHIAFGCGITLPFSQNIIIHNLHIHDIVPGSGGMVRDAVDHVGLRTASDGDGISLFGASNVWIDHVSLYRCGDGLIDAIMGSTAITISNCHFTNQNCVMLLGANDLHNDKLMQVTVAFNHFGKGLVQRMPRARLGFVHVVNNDYTHWLMYAIGGSAAPTIISQGNRFVAPPNLSAKEVTKRECEEPEWKSWVWRSEGDLLLNGATFTQSGDNNFDPLCKQGMIKAQPGHMVSQITHFAGTLRCKKGSAC